MTINWQEVTQAEFYAAIGSLDVHPVPEGNWPYTSVFKTPGRQVRGKVEEYLPEGQGLTQKRYWLPARISHN